MRPTRSPQGDEPGAPEPQDSAAGADTLIDDDGDSDAPDALDELDGLMTVDASHYVVREVIAQGGVGVVRRAHDRRARRDVVLKELQVPTAKSRIRFEREAWITAQLQHPSIVPVYEVGQWPDGRPFYAMKLVGGRPLDVVVDEALDADARLALIPRILPAVEAIAYAHEQGVIHRDLKPANVLLGEFGETVVIDWGLAGAVGDDLDEGAPDPEDLPPFFDEAEPTTDVEALFEGGKLTVDGHVVGTPAYMPPEQASGEAVDARADVYALGALLYHALSGVAPFGGDSVRQVLVSVVTEAPVPLAERAPSAPKDLVSIVDKAMARDKEDRYADARELARDLQAFARGRLVRAYQYTSWELVTRFVRRNRALSVAIVALAVLSLIGGGAVVRANQVSERERERAQNAERVAVGQERAAHAQLAQVYGREAARRLQNGDHLGAEVLAAAALREQPSNPASPHHALGDPDALTPAERAALLAGPAATWSAATALRFATRGHELSAHTDWVYDALPSPDGRWIVTTSADRRAIVWDARDGSVHATLTGHEATVFQAALRADGRELATSGYDGTVRLWSFPDGEPRRVIDHPSDRVYGLCYAGPRLLAAGHDALAVYDARTGALETEIPLTGAIPWKLRCDLDEGVGVLATRGAEVVLLDLDPPGIRRTIPHPSASVRCASLSADGATLITADPHGVLRRFDPGTGEQLGATTIGEPCDSMAISPDGRTIAIGSSGITVLDAATLRPIARLRGHRDDVVDLELDRTGRRLYSSSQDRRALEWVVPAERRAMVLFPPSTAAVDTVRPLGDGRLVSASDDGLLSVWDRGGRLLRTIAAHPAAIRGLAIVDGTRAVSAGMDRTLRVHDLQTGHSAPPVTLPHFGEEIATADGSARIAVGLGDGGVLLFDVDTGAQTVIADVHEGRAWWTGFDPSGRRLASASFDGTVAIVDPDAAEVLRSWTAHDERIYAADWRPDGAELTTADREGTVRAWDPETGERLRQWRLSEPVTGLTWSADGERLLVTTHAGMRVLDADGTPRLRLDLGATTTAARWTPDGRAIFASDGRIYVLPLDDETWRGDPEELLREAERAAGSTVNALIGVAASRE